MPNLYIVATPIGNLEDISLRALRILREVQLIAAEDTRKTKRLLITYNIQTPITSFHKHNTRAKTEYILGRLGEGDVALVCNAGMPGISDPGYELIEAATKQKISVVPIPGPSIVTTALVASGLSMEKFVFTGFLPRKVNDRLRLLKSIVDEIGTLVVLETPHRLPAALHDILLILGNRKLAICRELTKIHEEIFRGTVNQAIDHFIEPKGELALVIDGKQKEEKPHLTNDIEQQLHQMYLSGITAKEAIATIAGKTGLSRRELYQAWVVNNMSKIK
ncbi:16S rRNA (cytidine(1402)-2'-O)-methyltransferase [Chloroflexota bacterium]